MKLLILALDGTVRYSRTGQFIDGPDDVALYDGVEDVISSYMEKGYIPIAVSNQGGIAFGFKTVEDVEKEMEATIRLFKKGNPFAITLFCGSHPEGTVEPFNVESINRKPNYGMVAIGAQYIKDTYDVLPDIANSLVVGDMDSDKQLAENIGANFMWAEDWRCQK